MVLCDEFRDRNDLNRHFLRAALRTFHCSIPFWSREASGEFTDRARRPLGGASPIALPCKNQDEFWTDEQKRLYHNIIAEADEVIYVSEEYANGCMMEDQSGYCICALLRPMSGTNQTVRYARQKGLHDINVTT